MNPASAPPMICGTKCSQESAAESLPITMSEVETAGLKPPSEIEPTVKAPTSTVKPIARPK